MIQPPHRLRSLRRAAPPALAPPRRAESHPPRPTNQRPPLPRHPVGERAKCDDRKDPGYAGVPVVPAPVPLKVRFWASSWITRTLSRISLLNVGGFWTAGPLAEGATCRTNKTPLPPRSACPCSWLVRQINSAAQGLRSRLAQPLALFSPRFGLPLWPRLSGIGEEGDSQGLEHSLPRRSRKDRPRASASPEYCLIGSTRGLAPRPVTACPWRKTASSTRPIKNHNQRRHEQGQTFNGPTTQQPRDDPPATAVLRGPLALSAGIITLLPPTQKGRRAEPPGGRVNNDRTASCARRPPHPRGGIVLKPKTHREGAVGSVLAERTALLRPDPVPRPLFVHPGSSSPNGRTPKPPPPASESATLSPSTSSASRPPINQGGAASSRPKKHTRRLPAPFCPPFFSPFEHRIKYNQA